jgi:hypothetical protein
MKCWLIATLSEFCTTEIEDSLFHLCEHGDPHDHVDVDVVAAGTAEVNEDPVALYFGYYD